MAGSTVRRPLDYKPMERTWPKLEGRIATLTIERCKFLISTMEGAQGDWCLIESDPGVFTELIAKLGVEEVELQELWSLDDDTLLNLSKVYGLIFLFQWVPDSQQAHAARTEPLSEEQIPATLFFAHQVTTNACATQALLSILLNRQDSIADLGKTLTEFASFTSEFPPHLKGLAISSSEEIRTTHNDFARPDAFLHEGATHIPKKEEEEAFHFVAYVPHNGIVYELDGLQKGPIVVGNIDDSETAAATGGDSDAGSTTSTTAIPSWLALARTAIQSRMEGDAVKFNLMAVVEDQRVPLQAQLATLNESDPHYGNIMAELAAQEGKRETWKRENERRRHNYVPMCVQLLKELARAGKLPELIDCAKSRAMARRLALQDTQAKNGDGGK